MAFRLTVLAGALLVLVTILFYLGAICMFIGELAKLVFGGYSFAHVTKGDFKLEGWEKGITAIFRIMEVAGVDHWNKLKGSPVRAILKDQRIYAIAHFLEDKVMDYRLTPFKENG